MVCVISPALNNLSTTMCTSLGGFKVSTYLRFKQHFRAGGERGKREAQKSKQANTLHNPKRSWLNSGVLGRSVASQLICVSVKCYL